MTPRIFMTAILALAMALPVFAAQWLHVHVQERDQDETVKVNVPLSLALALAPFVEEEVGPYPDIRINRRRIGVRELREIWAEIKAEGDYEFVAVHSGDDHVVAALEGDFLIVRSREGSRTEVDVKLPVGVVDALLSAEDRLNFKAALETLSNLGREGFTLVDIRDGDERSSVRVWISSSSEQ